MCSKVIGEPPGRDRQVKREPDPTNAASSLSYAWPWIVPYDPFTFLTMLYVLYLKTIRLNCISWVEAFWVSF